MSLDTCVQAPEFLPTCQSAMACDELLAVILLRVLCTSVSNQSYSEEQHGVFWVFFVGNYYSKSFLKVVSSQHHCSGR